MSYKNFLNFFNFLSSFGFMNNNKSFKGFKVNRRGRRGNINKKMNYPFSSKTQVLGPVEKKLNINVDLIGANGSLNFSLGDVLNGREYLETASNFEMVKIVGVQVVAYPNDQLNNTPTYINLDYFNRIDASNIGASDRTKIVYNDLKHPKVFNYRVPPIYRNGQKLNDWMATSNAIANMNEGRLVVYTPSESATVNCRLVLRTVFKVPRTSSTAKVEQRITATDLNNYIKSLKEENEIKLNNKEIGQIIEENPIKEEKAPKKNKRQEDKKEKKNIKVRYIKKEKKPKLPVQQEEEEDEKEEQTFTEGKVYNYEQAKRISDNQVWKEETEKERRLREIEERNTMSDDKFKEEMNSLFSNYLQAYQQFAGGKSIKIPSGYSNEYQDKNESE